MMTEGKEQKYIVSDEIVCGEITEDELRQEGIEPVPEELRGAEEE